MKQTFSLKQTARVFVYKEPVRMSASFPKLSFLIKEHFEEKTAKLSSGDLFFFINKNKDYVKVIYYHNNGMCLFAKKIVKGSSFVVDSKATKISQSELSRILDNPDMPVLKVKKAA